MPRMDGIAAAREIKPGTQRSEVIRLSEYAYGYHADAMQKAASLRPPSGRPIEIL
jgi:hypothetical protein